MNLPPSRRRGRAPGSHIPEHEVERLVRQDGFEHGTNVVGLQVVGPHQPERITPSATGNPSHATDRNRSKIPKTGSDGGDPEDAQTVLFAATTGATVADLTLVRAHAHPETPGESSGILIGTFTGKQLHARPELSKHIGIFMLYIASFDSLMSGNFTGKYLGKQMTIGAIPSSPFTRPDQFEPLLPQSGRDALRERSRGVIERTLRLSSERVREMNSYYSNRIEGQGTHPRDIERALRRDFASEPTIARLQRLAVAHIEAERELESTVVDGGHTALSSAFVLRAHDALYGRLSEADRRDADGRVVTPGRWRTEHVYVGRHVAPLAEALPAFLRRFDDVYGPSPILEDQLLVVGAAHQRMAFIHPFLDGNGRACRLQTHTALWPLSHGLWSVSRGFARNRDAYYAHLDAADAPRAGDLDGRGNLSERALHAWCAWFIGVCDDQVTFMTQLFDLDGMKKRIHALIAFRSVHDKRVRMEAALPLYHLFVAGPTARGEFHQMTGLGERTARTLLSGLLETGLVTSAGHTAPVRFAFPLDALQFLLPGLYPEADTPAATPTPV